MPAGVIRRSTCRRHAEPTKPLGTGACSVRVFARDRMEPAAGPRGRIARSQGRDAAVFAGCRRRSAGVGREGRGSEAIGAPLSLSRTGAVAGDHLPDAPRIDRADADRVFTGLRHRATAGAQHPCRGERSIVVPLFHRGDRTCPVGDSFRARASDGAQCRCLRGRGTAPDRCVPASHRRHRGRGHGRGTRRPAARRHAHLPARTGRPAWRARHRRRGAAGEHDGRSLPGSGRSRRPGRVGEPAQGFADGGGYQAHAEPATATRGMDMRAPAAAGAEQYATTTAGPLDVTDGAEVEAAPWQRREEPLEAARMAGQHAGECATPA
uniref:Uncharacterized protein n=1 Tax=Ralstonia solanacearum TaxID=305 RepID=A0A0S4TVR5_RALSL|nr:protein of unknown function [Ralstonia solanacearum]